MKRALITGITGQDGAYLCQLLISKGYKVFGAYRRTSSQDFGRLKALGLLEHDSLTLLDFDITDPISVLRAVQAADPHEIYNLAAQSFVEGSFRHPKSTAEISGLGALNVLDAVRMVARDCRFYQAGTSEMFGSTPPPQSEQSHFHPRSPYASAKVFAHFTTNNYREAYGLFASNGILFNHESPLRGSEFVTKKIAAAVARYAVTSDSRLSLGNLDARRDWGYAPEYVEGMWRILQHQEPDDFVLATNSSTSVREFLVAAFRAINVDLVFEGRGREEKAFDVENGKLVATVKESLFRPSEVESLRGDYSKAKESLGWNPTIFSSDLAMIMVSAELEHIK